MLKILATALIATSIIGANTINAKAAETETYTVSGVYVFNDSVNDEYIQNEHTEDINYISNNINFDQMYITWMYEEEGTILRISISYYDNYGDHYDSIYSSVGETIKWLNESYKTIDFGTEEQTVSENFYKWLHANATKQEEPEPTSAAETILNIWKSMTEWISKTLTNAQALFYNTENQSLTLIGTINVVTIAIGISLLLINVVINFLKLRG